MAHCRRGDEEAWREMVSRFRPLILATATRRGLTGEERERIFQRTCVSIFEGLEAVREPSKLPGWISSIARRRAADYLRERGRQDPPGARRARDEAVEPEQEDHLFARERAALLEEALSRLSPRQRQVVEARSLMGMSHEEIEEAYGVPPGSVGPTQGRAYAWLRRILGPVLEGDEARDQD